MNTVVENASPVVDKEAIKDFLLAQSPPNVSVGTLRDLISHVVKTLSQES